MVDGTLVVQGDRNLAADVQFSPEQVDLIKRQICKGASDDELKMFLWQCKRTQLDPFSRQIYSIPRKDRKTGKMVHVTQTSIDGFRLIAERTGKYAGQLGPLWCGKDGKWQDVWLEIEPPMAAKVGVLHRDFKEPLWSVARFDAYAQVFEDGNLMGLWKTMPELMIGKCAEALGLRRAFPHELSGLYTSDEMAQADRGGENQERAEPRQEPKPALVAPLPPQNETPKASTNDERQSIKAGINEMVKLIGLKADDLDHWIYDEFRKKRTDLTNEEMQTLLFQLKTEYAKMGVKK